MGNKNNATEATQEITEFTLEDERRQFSRRAARWPSIITTRDKLEIHCRTQDISERGASIKSTEKLPKGTVVVLQIQSFYNGAKKSFKILAEIKHCAISKDEFTLGVSFKEASTQTFDYLRQYAENQI